MKVLKKIRPLWNTVITSMDVYEEDNYINGILDTSKAKGSLKEYQTVIAVGDLVKNIKVGDLVCIDPTRYMIPIHKDKSLRGNIMNESGDDLVAGYRFNTIKLDNKECLKLFDQDIMFIVEESEDVNTGPAIVAPERPKIVV